MTNQGIDMNKNPIYKEGYIWLDVRKTDPLPAMSLFKIYGRRACDGFIKSADLAAALLQAAVNPALVAPVTLWHLPRGTAISISGSAVLSR